MNTVLTSLIAMMKIIEQTQSMHPDECWTQTAEYCEAQKAVREFTTTDVRYCNTCRTEASGKDSIKDHEDAGCDLGSYWNWAAKKSGVNVVKLMENITNGSNIKDIVEGMISQMLVTHRHLQAEIVLVMVKFLAAYGDLDPKQHADGRNEYMMATAKRMAEVE